MAPPDGYSPRSWIPEARVDRVNRLALRCAALDYITSCRVVKRRGRVPLIAACCAFTALFVLLFAGCSPDPHSIGTLEEIWGRRGISPGRFQKPRAMAIDALDRLYIVDMTARIQVLTPEGQLLRWWSTPEHKNGRPTAMSIGRDGNLLVGDTHYHRVLIYSPDGKLLHTLGGREGHGPGEFGLVTDVVQDSHGNFYVAEYGDYDRIQKFSPDYKFLTQWGGHGTEPGRFMRPQNMAIDALDHVWVADACNHRIQVFDTQGRLLKMWGTQGSGLGQLDYPYDIALDGHGHAYVCEYGNHRIQKFTLDGHSLGCWGKHGRGPGEMHNPWSLVLDHNGEIYVLDTNNHRVQKIVM